ncbi:MAG: metal-dependent transcriptional regulator [Victivallaceae bacterium]|nr:metal-dependent transcriptional regulator [Victivallaceae bacterium]
MNTKDPSRISSNLEDYLEAIAGIIEEKKHAYTRDVSEKLEVSSSSVSSALQTLVERGMVRPSPQRGAPILLTGEGAERAAVIRRRHEALRGFLSDVLKIERDEADRIGCRIEHVIGEKVISRLTALSEAIVTRPDCAELRAFLDKAMPQIKVDSDEDLICLNQLPDGRSGVVVKVDETLRGLRKFADLGMVRGTLLTMEGRAPFGDLIRVKVMNSSLTLRSRDAACIQVRLVER